jgi:YD repeat-containing protein
MPTLAASSSAGDAVLTSLKNVQWDAENRLVGIVQASGTTGFVYDGAGHRLQETLNGMSSSNGSGVETRPARSGTAQVTLRSGSMRKVSRLPGCRIISLGTT